VAKVFEHKQQELQEGRREFHNAELYIIYTVVGLLQGLSEFESMFGGLLDASYP
jgi:hypothetical protein